MPRTRPPLILLCVIAGGCAANRPPAGDQAPPTRPARVETLRILAERLTSRGPRQALVFGDGVAFWNDESQVRLRAEDVTRLLAAFEKARFGEMPGFFGEGEEHLRCRVGLRSDGAAKEVAQLVDGEEAPALTRLANVILDLVAGHAASGVEPTGLADGLRRVATGELARQAFHLQVQRKPRNPRSDAVGYLLSVDEGVATLRSYSRQRYGEPRTLRLGPERFTALVAGLARHDPASIPINVHGPEYLEVRLDVLKWRRSLLAMPFAGTTPATFGEAQARFDRLAAELDALQREVAASGQEVP